MYLHCLLVLVFPLNATRSERETSGSKWTVYLKLNTVPYLKPRKYLGIQESVLNNSIGLKGTGACM